MRPTVIYLADLTHTGSCIGSEQVPLNVGLIGSYAKKLFGDDVEIVLFKFPEKLLAALEARTPDILGVSNYAWNARLAKWACREAKKGDKGVLTVMGGWNFPLDPEDRRKFLEESPETDIYVMHEGELVFAELVRLYRENGREGVLASRVNGSCYIDRLKSGGLVTGERMPDIKVLDDVPSPYVNGMLDEFLDGTLNPIVETTRGCPFKCNYCNSAIDEYNIVRRFSFDYLRKDFEYLAEKLGDTTNRQLMIPDANFGMYKQDRAVTEVLASMRKEKSWPQYVFVVGSGKGNTEYVLASLEPIKDCISPSLAFQSFNEKTLLEIKRKNIITSTFDEIAKKAAEIGFTIHSELILPLPYETLESYLDGLRTLMRCGSKKISTYTLQINFGTDYPTEAYGAKHGIIRRFRPIVYGHGKYGGEFVIETEQVAAGTNTMSLEDYVAARCYTFCTEIIYNNDIFCEVAKLLKEAGREYFDLVSRVHGEFPKVGGGLSEIFKSYIADTKGELSETAEEVVEFFSQEKNYRDLVEGRIGANVVFKHKTWMLSEHLEDLSRFVVECAKKLVREGRPASESDRYAEMLDCVGRFNVCKIADTLQDDDMDAARVYSGRYDVFAWMNDKAGRPLSAFEAPSKTDFVYSDRQKLMKRNFFAQYGATSIGKRKILAKLALLQTLFRQPVESPLPASAVYAGVSSSQYLPRPV